MKKLKIEPGKVYVTTSGAKVKLLATGKNPEVVFVQNVDTNSEFWTNIDRIKSVVEEGAESTATDKIDDESAKEAPAKPAKKPKAAKARAKAEAKPKKLSALDAAAKVLAEKAEAMTCQEMIDAMAAKGLWTSPNGKTPAATLYSAILREIGTKGKDARFQKTDRGKFARTNAD